MACPLSLPGPWCWYKTILIWRPFLGPRVSSKPLTVRQGLYSAGDLQFFVLPRPYVLKFFFLSFAQFSCRVHASTADHKFTEVLEEVVFPMESGESLGLSITGGSDDHVRPGDPGIYIKAVLADGAASRCGRLQEGDRLREINNISLDHVTHDEAVEAIRQALLSHHVSSS